MKILILNSARRLIGEAAHSLELTEQLNLQGHDARLVLRANSVLLERALSRNLPVAATPFFIGGFRPYTSSRDIMTIRKLLREFQPDILHCHRGDDHALAVAARMTIRSPGPAMVRTRHRVVPVHNSIPNRWLYSKVTDHVISVSQKAAASFGEMGKCLEPMMSVIYSSVDTIAFNPTRRSVLWRTACGVKDDEPLIGLIARLQRVKGQVQFLQAAALVLKEVPNAKFMIAGAGQEPQREKLKQLARNLGIFDRLIFESWLEDIHAVTASLDIGVLSSLGSEGSSRVTYEYMASGVPVVATSVGCIPEIVIDGHTGYIVPPANPDAMAAAIIRALRSPDMLKQMRDRARAHIESHYTRERWVAETVQAYEIALAVRQEKTRSKVAKVPGNLHTNN